MPAAFCSSCAFDLELRRTTLPYSACFTWSSTLDDNGLVHLVGDNVAAAGLAVAALFVLYFTHLTTFSCGTNTELALTQHGVDTCDVALDSAATTCVSLDR